MDRKEYNRAWRIKHKNDPKIKAAQLIHQRKYRQTEKGRMCQRKYNQKSERAVHVRWYRYKNTAKKKGQVFDITFERFSAFWQKPCVYCQSSIATIGLDRVDNSLGYIRGNIVSCCSICNYMKRNLSTDIFIEHCRRIVATAELDIFGDML